MATEEKLLSVNINQSNANISIDGDNVTQHKWYLIDPTMLSSKLCYLITYAKDACYKPFMILFVINTGLNPAEAGLINGLSFIGYMVGSPFWGYLADRFSSHKIISLLLCIFSIIFMCSQPFISIPSGDSSINTCPIVTNQTIKTSNQTRTILKEMEKPRIQNTSLLFWSLLGINTVANFFDGSILGFIDAGTIQRININPRKPIFGRQRLFGSIGYGAGSILGSTLVSLLSSAPFNCNAAVFIGYFVLLLFLIVTTQWLFHGISFKNAVEKKDNTGFDSTLLKSTLNQVHVIFFFLTVFVMGTMQGIYIYYTLVHLKSLSAPPMLNTIVIAVGSFPCIISFALSHRFIQLVGGRWKSMAFCCFTYSIRFVTMTFMKNPWLILLVQPLQAFGLGIFIATAVEHVRRISKPTIITTMYGIMNASHYAVSMIIANIVGGQIYNRYGGRILFFSAAVFAFFWSILVGIFAYFVNVEDNEQVTSFSDRNDRKLFLEEKV